MMAVDQCLTQTPLLRHQPDELGLGRRVLKCLGQLCLESGKGGSQPSHPGQQLRLMAPQGLDPLLHARLINGAHGTKRLFQ